MSLTMLMKNSSGWRYFSVFLSYFPRAQNSAWHTVGTGTLEEALLNVYTIHFLSVHL